MLRTIKALVEQGARRTKEAGKQGNKALVSFLYAYEHKESKSYKRLIPAGSKEGKG
jgi:hypothetical protein